MNIYEAIDLIELFASDDERRTQLERQLTPILERMGELPVSPKQQDRDRSLPCEYRGTETTIEKSCCGGSKRTVTAWNCGKTNKSVTMSDCMQCAEYPKAKRQEKPSRQSCIECVEKHLGAASVLLSEAQDGYTAHRMLAVGHLHEAAEESKEWLQLHAAIREARIKYQREGVVPDFTTLGALIPKSS